MAAPQMPSDPIAAARANATRPFKGRLVLTTWRDFTMGPFEANMCSVERWKRTVNSLYPIVNPLRQ